MDVEPSKATVAGALGRLPCLGLNGSGVDREHGEAEGVDIGVGVEWGSAGLAKGQRPHLRSSVEEGGHPPGSE